MSVRDVHPTAASCTLEIPGGESESHEHSDSEGGLLARRRGRGHLYRRSIAFAIPGALAALVGLALLFCLKTGDVGFSKASVRSFHVGNGRSAGHPGYGAALSVLNAIHEHSGNASNASKQKPKHSKRNDTSVDASELFKPVDGGKGRVCRGTGEHGESLVRSAESLEDCKDLCKEAKLCTGITYLSKGRCELWLRAIAGSHHGDSSSTCLRYEVPGFTPVGQSKDRACTGKNGRGDPESGLIKDMSLYECKAACLSTDYCLGIEHHENRSECKLWTDPIESSEKEAGSKCLRFEQRRTVSLYCVALVLPWTTEPDLIQLQHENSWGIFGCDQWDVYSNPADELGGVQTLLLDMDLHVKFEQGNFGRPLPQNTPVFKKFWKTLVADGAFRAHDWTLKADPDTVFFASRIKDIVKSEELIKLSHDGSGMVIQNCKLGLHGPLEVVARRALEVYNGERSECEEPPQEDVYLETCLMKLGAQSHLRTDLLAEADCLRGDWYANPTWYNCDSAHAAFHPLKETQRYKDCMYNAQQSDAWPSAL